MLYEGVNRQESSEIKNRVIDIVSHEGEADFEGAVDEFIRQRVTELIGQSEPTTIDGFTDAISGFIHPESEVHPTVDGRGYKIDDQSFYRACIEHIHKFRAMWGVDLSNPEDFLKLVVLAVQYTQQEYFKGLGTGGKRKEERENLVWEGAFMDDDEAPAVSISEFRGRAMCMERAAVCQNLLTLLGIESQMVNGKLKVADGVSELHSFLIITKPNGEHIIYDPANPVLLHDGDVVKMQAAIYPGGDQILAGETAKVNHAAYRRNEHGEYEVDETKPYEYQGDFSSRIAIHPTKPQ
jgi:hypothetical protein